MRDVMLSVAGATEVRFLYDERDNADCSTCLIDEGMRKCHGPALWVSDVTLTTFVLPALAAEFGAINDLSPRYNKSRSISRVWPLIKGLQCAVV